MRKSVEVTKENVLEFVDKAKRKLGPAYDMVRSAVSSACEEHSWKVVKGDKSVKYECTKCGKVSVCARKACPECGAIMVDANGVVRKCKH